MAVQADCPGCAWGEHDKHDEKAGVVKGLLGGTYCGCTGDCAERLIIARQEWVRKYGEMMESATVNEPTVVTAEQIADGAIVVDASEVPVVRELCNSPAPLVVNGGAYLGCDMDKGHEPLGIKHQITVTWG